MRSKVTTPFVQTNLGIIETEAEFAGQGPDMQDGVAFKRGLDTLYDNFGEDWVQNPKSASTPTPEPHGTGRYPHRKI